MCAPEEYEIYMQGPPAVGSYVIYYPPNAGAYWAKIIHVDSFQTKQCDLEWDFDPDASCAARQTVANVPFSMVPTDGKWSPLGNLENYPAGRPRATAIT